MDLTIRELLDQVILHFQSLNMWEIFGYYAVLMYCISLPTSRKVYKFFDYTGSCQDECTVMTMIWTLAAPVAVPLFSSIFFCVVIVPILFSPLINWWRK